MPREKSSSTVGTVYLAGAGPGDPRLLTVRAAELLARADAVVLDRLVNRRLVRRYTATARIIDAGKGPRGGSGKQDSINAKLIALAREGKHVVRLKGGDPTLFGRGGEEARALAAAGIPFEIVPGVTSAIAVPAYAGIPLTHREIASSVAIITGHEDPRKRGSRLNWAALAKGCDTLVCLMGVETLPRIAAKLIEHGREPGTPAAIIEWGTRAIQRTVTGTLQDIVERAQVKKIGPPALLVVGEVVRLRDEINWFETKPLFGRRILVTRAVDKAASLVERLENLGASVELLPAIELRPVRQTKVLKQALGALEPGQWVFFTSPAGMDWFVRAARRIRRDVRALHGCHIAAIGPKTAEAVEAYGVHVDLVAADFSQEGLLKAMASRRTRDVAAAIFCAAETRDVLIDGLRKLGMRAQKIAIYETVMPKASTRAGRELFERDFDAVTVTSASCASHVREVLKANDRAALYKKLPFASIGPVTSAEVRKLGGAVAIEARTSTIEGLVAAVEDYFKK